MSDKQINESSKEINLQMKSKNKSEAVLDMNKFNTHSNINFDPMKKSDYGFNEELDIEKFNSKISAYEKESNERKILVDQLFDESMTHDIAKEEEHILNVNSEINKNSNEGNERKGIHLFTESAHNLSARDSDLFGFGQKLPNMNNQQDLNKNSNSAFNFNYNVAGFENKSVNDHLGNQIDNENSNNRYNNGNQAKESLILPAYGNSNQINFGNANNNEKYLYKDQVVDKSYLVSRLFSDNINTEHDLNLNNLNESSLADPRENVNDNYNGKIEPPKILSKDDLGKINNLSVNNFRTQNQTNIRNPFDDTEDNIQSNNPNNESLNDFERINSKKLANSILNSNGNGNSNINISNNSNNHYNYPINQVNEKISNVNLNERISFNNPNFIVGNADNSSSNYQKESVSLDKRESGTNIISRLNDQPFKSINFGDHEPEADKYEKMNLNNFNSFDNNNKFNHNDLVKNDSDKIILNDDIQDFGSTSINNNINYKNSNNEIFQRNASIPFDKSFGEKVINEANKEKDEIKHSIIINPETKFKIEENLNEKVAAKEAAEAAAADRASKYLMNSQNPFMASDKNMNFDKSKKIFKDESDFNLLGADDSKGEINLEKVNSMKIKNTNLEKKSTDNILDEVDIEIDNDKLNEDNNFNFNLGLNNKSIKNYNDLEIKNQIGQQTNPSNNIDVANFNSKDFKNFDFNINKINSQVNQAPIFFADNNINNFDFDSNRKDEVLLTKAEKPKLEIKVSNSNNNNLNTNMNPNTELKLEEKLNSNFDMFRDFDNNKIMNKNLNFDFSATQPEKKLNLNPTNSIKSNSNSNNNPFNFEIKNNPNNPNNPNANFNSSLPVNPSRVIANGDYYEDEGQEYLLVKDCLTSEQRRLSDREREQTAEELMQKNQNINFDKIILDVFDKKAEKDSKAKKPKVNFDPDYHDATNDKNKNLIPPDYINLDDFQSGKMNEYNNQAVERNIRGVADNSVYAEEQGINVNIPNIEDNDDLYVDSNRDDYMLNNGIFNSYSEKHEKPFAKQGASGAKKIDYLKRKTRLIQDNLFSEEKSFAKLNKISSNNINDNVLGFKKYFIYDAEVIVSQIEAIFLDLFQNYDFDHLKKKLKNPSKDSKLRAQARISYLQTVPSFKANANLLNFNPGKLKTLETNAKYIREIKTDGNGFYRCFMFALIESYILNENISGIRNIINDINEIIDFPLSNNLEVNKQEIFGIFNCILENLELNDIGNAYALFVNAYGFSSNFDNCMIKYMRLALKKFLTQNESELFKSNKYPHIKETFPEEYLAPDKQTPDLKSYFKDRLLSFEFEADLTMISLAPLVFESSLDLFVIEGVNKEDFSEMKVLTQHIPSFSQNAENQILLDNLKILYRQARYSIIYSNQVAAKLESNRKFDLEKFVSNEKFSDKITVIADFKCEDCRSESKIIQIKKFNDLSLCENCLMNYLKRVIAKRMKTMIQDNFLNAEYYCRPIIIDEKGKFQINDDDFMFLFKSSLTKMLLGKFDSLCSICQNPEDPNQLVKLNCSCSFCEKCLVNYIDKATDGKILMNHFEKKNFVNRGHNNVLCPCGIAFEAELAVTVKYPNRDNLLKRANERLVATCKNICIYCLKDLTQFKNKPKVPGENPLYYVLKLKPENHQNKSVSNDDHIICKNCCSGSLKNYLGNLIRKKVIKIKDKTYPLECAICEVTHQVDSANLTKIMKSEGGCCEIL